MKSRFAHSIVPSVIRVVGASSATYCKAHTHTIYLLDSVVTADIAAFSCRVPPRFTMVLQQDRRPSYRCGGDLRSGSEERDEGQSSTIFDARVPLTTQKNAYQGKDWARRNLKRVHVYKIKLCASTLMFASHEY